MYTDTQQAIRNTLWNFMGSLMEASSLDDSSNKKESTVALVSEELCKFVKTENDSIDIKSAKPILKSAKWILEARKLELSKLPIASTSVDNNIKELDGLIASLNAYINKF